MSKDTAVKVRTAALTLSYRSNILGRAMNTRRSRVIGLVVAYFENQVYLTAIERLSAALQAEEHQVLVVMASDDNAATQTVIDALLDCEADAIIAASVGLSNNLTQRCEGLGIPTVLFNRHQDDGRLSSVTCDQCAGGRNLAEFPLAGCHKRIAHSAGWRGGSTQRDKEAAFLRMRAAGGAYRLARCVGNFNFETVKQIARDMFRTARRPDALFKANDHMAFAVMDVLRFELGQRVPEDVSVVGYDGVALSAWPSHDVTTVRQPANRMVRAMVDILIGRLNNGAPDPRAVTIDGPLIVRRSARKPQEMAA